jgi:hypothetical protein
MSHRRWTLLLATTMALLAPAARAVAEVDAPAVPLLFSVTYDPSVAETYTGRVYVLCTQGRRDPRFGPGWFSPDPFIALDVEGWKPGEPLRITADEALAYPTPMGEIPHGEWKVQAVLRLDPDAPKLGSAPGNAHSAVHTATFSGTEGGAVDLHVDRFGAPRALPSNDRVRVVEVRSERLSAFHGRDISMRAAVILPAGFDEDADRRYPAMYVIPGFGGDHTFAFRLLRRWDATGYGDRLVRVVLDPLCYGGHHVFADSANNGPRGTALVEELIPHLEARLPIVAAPTARFLWGHSSGGWSSLWLQVTYPEFFGGVWSTAPDPVDFSSYQLIDIYAPGANAYVTADGGPMPVAHRNGTPFATYRDFSTMETVYGDGGQLRSFEWVFSPPSGDGGPMPLYDRTSGKIDPQVAEAWKRYDIRLVLEQGWATLGPKLAGKLNVFVGDQDTFYLSPAVEKLKGALERLGSDAVVEIHEGKDHGSLMTPELMERIDREAVEAFERVHR